MKKDKEQDLYEFKVSKFGEEDIDDILNEEFDEDELGFAQSTRARRFSASARKKSKKYYEASDWD